jgi:hypothetical protein
VGRHSPTRARCFGLLSREDNGDRRDTTRKLIESSLIGLLQPTSCKRWPNHLMSMQLPDRNPAVEWRSARERHGQNDIMPGVRRHDLS